MLQLNNVNKTFSPATVNEKHVLRDLDLTINDGDFITVIGGNGAGKSTLLNVITGAVSIDTGEILLNGEDISKQPEHKRAKHFGRVFQDPMMGTAPAMWIEENLSLAYRRGKMRGLSWSITNEERKLYRKVLSRLDLGLEDRLQNKVGQLSGGQRQALTLLMATLQKPYLLLLDEHTAALDPKTAKKVLELTSEIVAEENLTTLMITHNMRDAIRIGNRLIMMYDGKIIYDVSGEEKQNLKTADLMAKFEDVSQEEFASDRMLLA